ASRMASTTPRATIVNVGPAFCAAVMVSGWFMRSSPVGASLLANKGLVSERKPLRMKGVAQRSGNLARQPCVGSFCNTARSSVREQARSYCDAAGGGSMAASIDHPPFQREESLRSLLDEED